MIRVGMGYDVHKLTEGRDLILGGVNIPWEKGLLGHSDADVVVHAIMDALLGAAALRDIGRHFPDTDPKYKGISSILLLQHVGKLLEENMYVINNIDATIIAQKPKLLPYIDTMIKNVAQALHLEENQVNIKATTEEGLGFTGSMEGISAHAICALTSVQDLMGDDRSVHSCQGCCRQQAPEGQEDRTAEGKSLAAVFPGSDMKDILKTPVKRPETIVAAGKGNVADWHVGGTQKMGAVVYPVLIYQIRKGKTQMAVDKSGDIQPAVAQMDGQVLKSQCFQIMVLNIDQDLMEQV